MDYNTASRRELIDAVLERGLVEHQVEAEKASRAALISMLTGEPVATPTTPTTEKRKSNNSRVSLTIFEQEGSDGGQDVCVSVNGKAYQIKRGVEVEVPPEVVQVLETAVITVFESLKDGGVQSRDIKRFNYSVRA